MSPFWRHDVAVLAYPPTPTTFKVPKARGWLESPRTGMPVRVSPRFQDWLCLRGAVIAACVSTAHAQPEDECEGEGKGGGGAGGAPFDGGTWLGTHMRFAGPAVQPIALMWQVPQALAYQRRCRGLSADIVVGSWVPTPLLCLCPLPYQPMTRHTRMCTHIVCYVPLG